MSTTISAPPAADDQRLCLTRRELARAIGLSERTISTLTGDGEIPYVRIGHSIRYPREIITQWLREKAGKALTHAG